MDNHWLCSSVHSDLGKAAIGAIYIYIAIYILLYENKTQNWRFPVFWFLSVGLAGSFIKTHICSVHEHHFTTQEGRRQGQKKERDKKENKRLDKLAEKEVYIYCFNKSLLQNQNQNTGNWPRTRKEAKAQINRRVLSTVVSRSRLYVEMIVLFGHGFLSGFEIIFVGCFVAS